MSTQEIDVLNAQLAASGVQIVRKTDAPPTVSTTEKPKAKPAPKATTDATLLWIYRAIEYYRAADGNKSKGIHTVISGFNGAFKLKFGKNPVDVTTAYVAAGKLEGHFARKGYMLYKPGEMPTQRSERDYSADVAAIG